MAVRDRSVAGGVERQGIRRRGWRTGSAALGFGSTAVATNIDVPPPTSSRPLAASAAGLQTAGSVGVGTYLSRTAAPNPLAVTFDDFLARRVG